MIYDNIKNMISVIIPVYNAEKYLDRLFKSFLLQFNQDFELICIYQQSKDKTHDLLMSWSKQFGKFLILDSVEPNLSSNRNLGLTKASGDYFTFVDADDEISSDFISDAYTCIYKDNPDIVLFYPTPYPDCKGSPIFNSSKIFDYSLNGNDATKYLLEGKTKKHIFRFPFNMNCPYCKIYKSSLKKYVNFKGAYLEDFNSSYIPLFYARKIACVTGDHYHYYTNNSGSIMNTKHHDYFNVVLSTKYERTVFYLKNKKKYFAILSIHDFYNTFNTFYKNACYFKDELKYFDSLFQAINKVTKKVVIFNYKFLTVILKKYYLKLKWQRTFNKYK